MKQIVKTTDAPAAIGPYNQAVIIGDLVFTAGQIALDPNTGKLIEGSFRDRVRRVMENLRAVLEAAGSDFSKVLKVTIYVTDLAAFGELNQIYGEYFPDGEQAPARSTVQVAALPLGTDVEIDMVAYR